MADDFLYERVALIGIGLVGSSLARALRTEGLAKTIVASARTQASLDTALRLGLCDATTLDPAEAASGSDLVVLCTPLGTYRDLAARIVPAMSQGATLSDVGSAKQCVIDDVGPQVPEGVHFIPGHPVAGTEYSGPESGFAELFHGRYCILTPPPGTDPAALDRLAEMWRRCGMLVEKMDPHHHDLVLAMTSHLPHLIAYTIVGTATEVEEHLKAEVAKFSAGGFRDFTRIAASDPIMWRDVFLKNREAVLEVLGRFSEDLTALQRAIRRSQGDKLEELFNETREIRRRVIAMHQE
jgi:cyclohexadieny/prephenate dehydrogenase